MNDVFLSYAREDQERAQRLASALEAQGWKIWWDRLIAAGKTFDEVIQAALDDTRIVVVLWSESSVRSNWVKEEASEGARREILVPCLIDDVRIPLGFGRIQTASLIDWNGEPDHPGLEQLCAAVTASIEAATARATARVATLPKPAGDGRPISLGIGSPSVPAAASPAARRRFLAPLLAGLLVAVLGVGYGGYAVYVSPDDASPPIPIDAPVVREEVDPPDEPVVEPESQEPGPSSVAAPPAVEPASGDEGPGGEDPPEPAPRRVWVSGLAFSQAVELAGGGNAVSPRASSKCNVTGDGDDLVAWVKSGATGNKCQFRLNDEVRVLPDCRIVGWEIDEPEPESFRWVAEPQVGTDVPMFELRIWSNPLQGLRRLKLRKVQLSVPSETPTLTAGELALLDAPTLAARCLEAV